MEDKKNLPKTEEPIAPPASVDPLEEKIDKVLKEWVQLTYFNSPVSRDTPAYNHLRSKLPDLKSALMKELKE